MTFAERMRREGRQEGLKEGRQEGLKEGKATGFYTLLLSQLEERFVDIPDRFIFNLKCADIDTLNRFGRHLFRWNTLAEAEQWWEEKALENDN